MLHVIKAHEEESTRPNEWHDILGNKSLGSFDMQVNSKVAAQVLLQHAAEEAAYHTDQQSGLYQLL